MVEKRSAIFAEERVLQVGLLLVLYLFLLPAIIQFIEYGHFIYTNGADEADYLSYEFSSKVQGITRLSSYLVTKLHEIGLSGGEINFCFDFFALTLLGIVVPQLVKHYYPQVSVRDIYLAALIVILTPVLLTYRNPIIGLSIDHIASNEFLGYFVVAAWDAGFPIYLRSPESQLSIVSGICLLWVLVKMGKPYLILLITPFMYYYVGMLWFSIAIIYGLIEFIDRNKHKLPVISPVIISAVTGFIFIGLLHVFIFKVINLGRAVVQSHMPVFGLSFFLLLVFYGIFFLKRNQWNLDNKKFWFISAVVAGVFSVYNTNVLSGYIIQPQHFEFEVNLLIGLFAGILFLTLKSNRKGKVNRKILAVYILFILLFMFAGAFVDYRKTQINSQTLQALKGLPDFEESIRSNEIEVAINDIRLSSLVTGLYLPKGKALLTSREGVFGADDHDYSEFLHLKDCVAEALPEDQEKMKPVLDKLEDMYINRFENFLSLYKARRKPEKYSYTRLEIDYDCSKIRIYLVPDG